MPQYVSQEELKTVGIPEVIDMITGSDDAIVETIITETLELVSGYLSDIYDVDAEYAKIGGDRNALLMKIVKDIVIYETYIRETRELNEVARLRYEDAMSWLLKASKGQITVKLPFSSGGDADGDGEQDGEMFLHTGDKPYETRF